MTFNLHTQLFLDSIIVTNNEPYQEFDLTDFSNGTINLRYNIHLVTTENDDTINVTNYIDTLQFVFDEPDDSIHNFKYKSTNNYLKILTYMVECRSSFSDNNQDYYMHRAFRKKELEVDIIDSKSCQNYLTKVTKA